MAAEHEPIPSARVKLYVVPPGGGAAILVGLVEDFSTSMQYRSENFMAVGEPIPPDNVTNFGDGRLRWGKVHQLNNELQQVIAPQVATFTQYDAFDLLALDPKDNKPIKYVLGARADSLEFLARGGAAPRENFQGICRAVLHGDEISKATGA